MDRRKKKSRDAIITAFLDLLAVKHFEKITINEIAEKADVSRGTVYLNFMDKYDLLNECIEISLATLFESCMHGSKIDEVPTQELLLRTFRYLEKNAAFYRTLLTNQGVPHFRERLLKETVAMFEQQALSNKNGLLLINEVAVQFLSSAIVGVLVWWFTSEKPQSAESVTEQLWDLMEKSQLLVPVTEQQLGN